MRARGSGEGAEDLVELGEAVLPLLREDDVPVGDDVELGAPAFDGLGVVALAPSSVARLTARLSYPLQTGQ